MRETIEELVARFDAELSDDPQYDTLVYVGAVVRHDGALLYSAWQAMEADVAESPVSAPETAQEKPKPEEKETPEEIRKRARKPPAEGPCRGCGKNLPLNRLMLCYRCWIKKRLEERGWKEGQPHPTDCGCDLDCRFDSKGDNN